jgi:hypothetical protein
LLRVRRITSSEKYLPEIDGRRFVAVLSVVLYHLSGFLPNSRAGLPFHAAIVRGYRGVNLFYVISGFVLGLPFASHYLAKARPASLRAYFNSTIDKVRASLHSQSPPLFPTQAASPRALLPHLGASVRYLHNLVYGDQSSINPVAWH